MRNLMLIAGALWALACTAAFAADENGDTGAGNGYAPGAPVASADGPDWDAGAPAMRVMGLLSKSEVQALRDAHARAGLELGLSIVPAGGINAGKYYVSGTLSPELMAQMEAAHEAAGIRLDLRAMPLMPEGVVMGDTRIRQMAGDDDADEDEDDDTYGDDDDDRQYSDGGRGDWHGGPGEYGPGARDGRRWHKGGRGMRGHGGWRGGVNYDVRDHCGHWEQDWHQDGCGTVHVHNLADWLPNHAGWGFGFPYGGWDDDFWPHVRNDGSSAWYSGAWWAGAHPMPAPPAWFDAQWAMFGDAYPDTWWLSTWQGHGWNWRGHGTWGASCGCGGHCGGNKCGCGCHRGWR